MLNSWVLIRIDFYFININYSVNQNYCYILIIPAFGIVSQITSTFSGKPIFGQNGPLYLKNIMQQTIFGEIYREIYFLYLVLNNPQITKALSVALNFTLGLEIIKYLIISKTYKILGLVFKKITLNNNNNFFNSLKYKLINSHLIYTIFNRHMVTYNSSFLFLTKLFYSVLLHNNKNLHPYFITGFVDGEGCFFINIRPRPNRKKGYAVELLVKITLSSKDKLLLEKIKNFFGVGTILHQGSSVSFNVRSLNDIQIIVNHFDNYPLITQKWSDYQLFKQVFELMKQKQHLNSEGLNQIVAIKAVSNKGFSDKLKILFPDVIPALRSLVNSSIIPNPYWVAGFVEGEGSFYIKISNKNEVSFRFLVTQHVRDMDLLKNLAVYLNCGYAKPRSNSINHSDFFATKKEDIKCKILPFFEKYTLQGNKLNDFLDFKKAVELKCNYTSLTPEILAEIVQIKQGMNKNRLPENYTEITSQDSNFSSTTKPNLTKKSVGSELTKRHYSSTIIREKQSKFDQIKYLEWLAGLIDGDGQFKTTKKGFSSFNIIMDIEDKAILYEIKHRYGGSIKSISGSNSLKYKLLNNKGLMALIKDINGLIRNPIRMLQLSRICENYNIDLLEPKPLVYLNGWFSGFIDSNGSIHIDEKSNLLTICVTKKNKYLLDPLQILYGGRIKILSYKEAFQFSIFRKNDVLDLMEYYFKYFPLKSHKTASRFFLIKEFYLLKDYKDLNVKEIDKFNQWVSFKNKWDRL